MNTPYVCLSCRTRLIASKATRSFGRQISRQAPNRQNGGGIESFWDGHGHGRGEGNGNGNGRSSQRDGVQVVRGRYSGRALKPEQLLAQVDTPEPEARRTRNNNRQQQQQQQPYPYARPRERPPLKPKPPTPPTLPPELQKPLDLLLDRTSSGHLHEAWSALQELAKLCSQRPVRDTITLYRRHTALVPALSQLLSRLTVKWLHGLQAGDIDLHSPTPHQVLRTLHALNNTSGQFYCPTLWHVARQVATIRFSEGGEDSAAVRQGREELVKIWRLCIGAHLTRAQLGGSITDENRAVFAAVAENDHDWTFLPPPRTFADWTQDRRSHDMVASMLAMLVPPPPRDDALKADYTSSAIVTWDLLQVLPPVLYGGSPLYAPLVSVLGAIFKHASAPRVPPFTKAVMKACRDPAILEGYRAMLARVDCEDLPAVMRELNAAKPAENEPATVSEERASGQAEDSVITIIPLTGNVAPAKDQIFEHVPRNPETEKFALTQTKRLGRAHEREDMTALNGIKNDILKFHKTVNDRLPIEVYEQLMLVALSLRNAKLAIDIWHLLPQLGHKPTLKTYTSMLRGAQNSRDGLGMEAFWHKMRQDGFKPDAHAWSIRIFGLIKLHSARQGLQALYQMGQEWLAVAKAKASREQIAARDPAARRNNKQLASSVPQFAELLSQYPGPIDGVPRPTLVVMNAAISGLATSRPREIPRVFSWGRTFGIEPDLVTYNALLALAMRTHQGDEAFDILHQMQLRGINADSTTWTVLFTSLFDSGFIDNMTPAEQETKIMAFIESLNKKDSGGPGLDEKSYALIIDRLLKRYENTAGAAAVFRHMISSGRKPSAHIYTILMTSYFQQRPEPDFASIDSLWRQIQDQGKSFSSALDTIFFDRMIEGYAAHHHIVGTKHMEEFLKYARDFGKHPGWPALQSVAQVYVEMEQWNKLRGLIDEVRVAQRALGGRISRQGEHQFWNYIFSTGILQDEGVSRDQRYEVTERGSALTRAMEGRSMPVLTKSPGTRPLRQIAQ